MSSDASIPAAAPATSKPVKSWKQQPSSAPPKKSAAAIEAEEIERAERNQRKVEENARMQEVNANIAADLLGGFQIVGSRHVPSQDIAGLDFMNNDSASSSAAQSASSSSAPAAPARKLTDTISEYPITKDDDYEQFATAIADRLLNVKAGSATQQSQRLLKFSRLLTKKISEKMRSDEIKLLQGHVTVLLSDKTTTKRVVGQGNKAVVNAVGGKAGGKAKGSGARNTYHDDDEDDDGYDDTGYVDEDSFM